MSTFANTNTSYLHKEKTLPSWFNHLEIVHYLGQLCWPNSTYIPVCVFRKKLENTFLSCTVGAYECISFFPMALQHCSVSVYGHIIINLTSLLPADGYSGCFCFLFFFFFVWKHILRKCFSKWNILWEWIPLGFQQWVTNPSSSPWESFAKFNRSVQFTKDGVKHSGYGCSHGGSSG